MAIISDLSNELLVHIYSNLGSIDDALHLGRTCSTTHIILENPKFHLSIMRSIIMSSDIHRFDICLCKVLDLHSKFVDHYSSGGALISGAPTSSPHPTSNTFGYFDQELWERVMQGPLHTLKDSHVYDILARWQGLRVLQDLYLARELTDYDYINPLNINPRFQMDRLDTLQDRSYSHYSRCHPQAHGTLQPHSRVLDSHQTARFYSAVTYYWLINEIRWCLSHITFKNIQYLFGLRYTFQTHLETLTASPLLFTLDVLSIYEFLYLHLLPNHSRCFEEQDPAKTLLTCPSRHHEDRAQGFQECLAYASSFLQPPDLIDLAIRDRLVHKWPYAFLPYPDSFYTHTHPTPDAHYNITNCSFSYRGPPTMFQSVTPYPVLVLTEGHHAYLKSRVFVTFKDGGTRPNPRTIEEVFIERWSEEVRGSVFFWAQSSIKAEMLMERWREEKPVKRQLRPRRA
ncbi:hypothetical protein K432DRAFT_322613 [Lepidopterella palustris CBS 459.81]|uniref:F-box domain-containing protein n=1 Tax=Lepidopterella palustris CBS 459.81 TaxID=1314670 RepID=A0A8E2EGA2_9PEZI|nr:hypothetical protein K432DRAFT_322613 [Lepidopterella palustris CBS 459.81]